MAHKPEDIADPSGTTVLERKPEKQTKRPKLWKVIILNDDFTPMDFVVAILMKYFYKTVDEAAAITMEVHQKGAGVAGVFTWEIAETKIGLVAMAAREGEYPLRLIVEPADEE